MKQLSFKYFLITFLSFYLPLVNAEVDVISDLGVVPNNVSESSNNANKINSYLNSLGASSSNYVRGTPPVFFPCGTFYTKTINIPDGLQIDFEGEKIHCAKLVFDGSTGHLLYYRGLSDSSTVMNMSLSSTSPNDSIAINMEGNGSNNFSDIYIYNIDITKFDHGIYIFNCIDCHLSRIKRLTGNFGPLVPGSPAPVVAGSYGIFLNSSTLPGAAKANSCYIEDAYITGFYTGIINTCSPMVVRNSNYEIYQIAYENLSTAISHLDNTYFNAEPLISQSDIKNIEGGYVVLDDFRGPSVGSTQPYNLSNQRFTKRGSKNDQVVAWLTSNFVLNPSTNSILSFGAENDTEDALNPSTGVYVPRQPGSLTVSGCLHTEPDGLKIEVLVDGISKVEVVNTACFKAELYVDFSPTAPEVKVRVSNDSGSVKTLLPGTDPIKTHVNFFQ